MRIFRPPRARFLLAVLVLGTMGAFSLTSYLFPRRNAPPEWEALIGSAICFTLTGSILVFALRNRSTRIAVCPGGLLMSRGGAIDAWPWDEIASVREQETPDRFYFVKVATYRAATVTRRDGSSFFVDRNRVVKAGELIDIILQRVSEHRSRDRIDDPDLAQIEIIDDV